eukprot:219484-Alexandrium_andersonii.AAC.1
MRRASRGASNARLEVLGGNIFPRSTCPAERAFAPGTRSAAASWCQTSGLEYRMKSKLSEDLGG